MVPASLYHGKINPIPNSNTHRHRAREGGARSAEIGDNSGGHSAARQHSARPRRAARLSVGARPSAVRCACVAGSRLQLCIVSACCACRLGCGASARRGGRRVCLGVWRNDVSCLQVCFLSRAIIAIFSRYLFYNYAFILFFPFLIANSYCIRSADPPPPNLYKIVVYFIRIPCLRGRAAQAQRAFWARARIGC